MPDTARRSGVPAAQEGESVLPFGSGLRGGGPLPGVVHPGPQTGRPSPAASSNSSTTATVFGLVGAPVSQPGIDPFAPARPAGQARPASSAPSSQQMIAQEPVSRADDLFGARGRPSSGGQPLPPSHRNSPSAPYSVAAVAAEYASSRPGSANHGSQPGFDPGSPRPAARPYVDPARSVAPPDAQRLAAHQGYQPATPLGSRPASASDYQPGAPLSPRPASGAGYQPGAPLSPRPASGTGYQPGAPLSPRPASGTGYQPGAPLSPRPTSAPGYQPGAPLPPRPGSSPGFDPSQRGPLSSPHIDPRAIGRQGTNPGMDYAAALRPQTHPGMDLGRAPGSRPDSAPFAAQPRPMGHPHGSPSGAAAPAAATPVQASDEDFVAALQPLVAAAGLTPSDVHVLAQACWRERPESGALLFADGAPASAAYLPAEGILRQEFLLPDGSSRAATALKVGEWCGEAALAGGRVHAGQVVAATDATVFVFTAQSIANLAKTHPGLLVRLLAEAALHQARRVRGDQTRIDQLVQQIFPRAQEAAATQESNPAGLGKLLSKLTGGKEVP